MAVSRLLRAYPSESTGLKPSKGGSLTLQIFAGGCFFAAATVEMDGRPGPVRDAVAAQMTRWAGLLTEYIREAVDRGELRADTDAEQLAFELDALGSAANHQFQLFRDPKAFDVARAAIRSRLDSVSA